MFEPLVFVAKTSRIYVRIFNFRQYQDWLTRLVKEKLQERKEKSCLKLENIDRKSPRGKNMDHIYLDDVKIVKIQMMMMTLERRQSV